MNKVQISQLNTHLTEIFELTRVDKINFNTHITICSITITRHYKLNIYNASLIWLGTANSEFVGLSCIHSNKIKTASTNLVD